MSHLSIFSNDVANSLVENASIINFKFIERRQRQQDSLKTKIKFLKIKKLKITKFVNCRMKLVVLSYSESYSKEAKCTEVKINPFSCNQEYCWTNSIRNAYASTIIFQSTFPSNLRLMRPLFLLYMRQPLMSTLLYHSVSG